MIANPENSSERPPYKYAPEEGIERPDLLVEIADGAGGLSAVLGPFPAGESFRFKTGASGKILFGRELHVAGRGDRMAIGNNDAFRIRVYDDSAKLLHIIAQARDPVVIRSEDVDAEIEERASEYTMPTFKQRMRVGLKTMPRPSTLPAFASL